MKTKLLDLGVPLDAIYRAMDGASTVRDVLEALLTLSESSFGNLQGELRHGGEQDLGEPEAKAQDDAPSNRWNAFQRRMKGAGLNSTKMAELYQEEKAAQGSNDRTAVGGQKKTISRPLEAGYLLLRAPRDQSHLRGHHRCDWEELLGRLGLQEEEWWSSSRGRYYLIKYTTLEDAERKWVDQRLVLPIPVDPR